MIPVARPIFLVTKIGLSLLIGAAFGTIMLISFNIGKNTNNGIYTAMSVQKQKNDQLQLVYYKKPPKTSHKLYQPGKFTSAKLFKDENKVIIKFYNHDKIVKSEILAGIR